LNQINELCKNSINSNLTCYKRKVILENIIIILKV
jgi:hypothetical protein